MIITSVTLWRLRGAGPGLVSEDVSANALDVYPGRLEEARSARNDGLEAIYLTVGTDQGGEGLYGPINSQQAFLIAGSLRPLLLGQDALGTARLHDEMLRLERHGRSGLFVTAVSAVDNALWDLKGKVWDKPVWRLLGGPTRSEIPAYASMLSHSIKADRAASAARQYKEQGYRAQKWFFRYGPAHGPEGRRKNLEMARAVRDAVGPDYELMFDAFMGWDLPYAAAMARELEEVKPRWLEEPLPPERIAEFRKLKAGTGIPLASGEHVYTRWQVRTLIDDCGIDLIQTDPDWAGGISEQIHICSLCSARDVPVVAHGHTLVAALHVAAAQSPQVVPMVEYLIRHQERIQYFHKTKYRPVGGAVALPAQPGLGIQLDEDVIESRTELTF